MTVTLARHAPLESVSVQRPVAVSKSRGQGKPSYGTASVIQARVDREEDSVRALSGPDIRTFATLWVAGDQTVLPDVDDRLTLSDGTVGIVVAREVQRTIQSNALDHVELKVREE